MAIGPANVPGIPLVSDVNSTATNAAATPAAVKAAYDLATAANAAANADVVIPVLSSDPSSPAQGRIWILKSS